MARDELMTKQDPRAESALVLRRIDPIHGVAQTLLSHVIDPVFVSRNGVQIFAALDAPRAVAVNCPWLHLTLDGLPGAVQLPWGSARRLAGLPVEGSDPGDAALLIETGLAPWLEEVEAALGVAIRFSELSAQPGDLPVETVLSLKGKDVGGGFVDMRQAMRLSVDAAAVLGDALNARVQPRPDLPGLMLRLFWERDALTLTRVELADLRAGDALALSDDAHRERVVLEGQSFAEVAPIADQPQTLRLTSGFQQFSTFEEGTDMNETAETDTLLASEDPAHAGPVLDDIDLRLSFRAGEVSVPMSELRHMGPGSIIEMTDPANATVAIVVNGRTVGSGELIDLGGRRAVQIRRLFASS